jgi:hypothetical protein
MTERMTSQNISHVGMRSLGYTRNDSGNYEGNDVAQYRAMNAKAIQEKDHDINSKITASRPSQGSVFMDETE